MANAFLKTEPVGEAGPALVIGAAEEAPPIAPNAPLLTLSGEMAAPIARDYVAGDDFNGTGNFRVRSIDGDNVELELISLTPSGEPSDASAEGAIDQYLAGKGGTEEELV